MRSIRVGRLSLTWASRPLHFDPVRLQSKHVGVYDVASLTFEPRLTGEGVAVDQVIMIQGSIRIVAETRFYSLDFYRSAIAKFEEGAAVYFSS